MVEGARLLSEYRGNPIEGSNPFVSATHLIYRLLQPFVNQGKIAYSNYISISIAHICYTLITLHTYRSGEVK